MVCRSVANPGSEPRQVENSQKRTVSAKVNDKATRNSVDNQQ